MRWWQVGQSAWRRIRRSRRFRRYLVMLSLIWVVLKILSEDERRRILLTHAADQALAATGAIQPFAVLEHVYHRMDRCSWLVPCGFETLLSVGKTVYDLSGAGWWVLVPAVPSLLAMIFVAVSVTTMARAALKEEAEQAAQKGQGSQPRWNQLAVNPNGLASGVLVTVWVSLLAGAAVSWLIWAGLRLILHGLGKVMVLVGYVGVAVVTLDKVFEVIKKVHDILRLRAHRRASRRGQPPPDEHAVSGKA
jgi:hypothetical protein